MTQSFGLKFKCLVAIREPVQVDINSLNPALSTILRAGGPHETKHPGSCTFQEKLRRNLQGHLLFLLKVT